MSAEPDSTDSSIETTNYRIELSDIRGVGERVIDYLKTANITTVEEVHLLRKRSMPAYQTLLSRGVGSATMKHLQAVGEAVHYSGSDRVKSKHLTLPAANHAPDHKFIDLTEAASPTGSDTEAGGTQQSLETTVPEYDPETGEIGNALNSIRDDYDSGMSGQNRLHADLNRFISESEQFGDVEIPLPIIFSVLRWEHDAETLTKQGDYEPVYGSVLIEFDDDR